MRRMLLFLALATSVRADFAVDGVPAAPDILARIISAAERSEERLRSRATNSDGAAYYLRSAEYIGECGAPFGTVHLARLFFLRSGVRGQATPPPRGYTFIVFLDAAFKLRATWAVDHDLEALSVSGSKVLAGDVELFDFLRPPASGQVLVDGCLQAVPRW